MESDNTTQQPEEALRLEEFSLAGVDNFVFLERGDGVVDTVDLWDGFSSDSLRVLGIENIARQVRATFDYASAMTVDLIDIVEFALPQIYPEFCFSVIDDQDEPPGVLAFTRVDPPEIAIKESPYKQAVDGHPEARFILAHELGHLVLHRPYLHPRTTL